MNRKFIVAFLYVTALTFSFIKTIRLPNEWSEAHWLMDYRFGFIKRGLAGEIFGFFFEKNVLNIQILSSVILLLLYAALVTVALRHTFHKYSIRKVLFYMIFFLSQYVVLSAHLIGYLDHVIFLFTLLAIHLIKNKKIFLASLLAVFSVILHEISFFLMIPICVFAILVYNLQDKKLIFSISLLRKVVFFLLFPIIATISVSFYQELHGRENGQLILHYLESTGFISKKVAFIVSSAYTESFWTYFKEQSPYFFDRVFLSKNTIKFGLPILFTTYIIFREFRKVDLSILIILIIVSLFPLLLHAIAWDTFRIWSFPFMILFLGFWILGDGFNAEEVSEDELPWFEILFFIISVIFVAVFQNILFENEIERISKIERCLFLVPIFILTGYLYVKKSPNKKILRP